jgi:regulation of enolase protein 1 (concanavalin A-like superfamily)
MVLWNETSVSLPMRFQIPRGYCEYGISQFGQVSVKISDTDFLEWFKNVELTFIKDCGVLESRVNFENSTISLKYVDGYTQIFDSSNALVMTDEPNFIDCELDCLVDVERVYTLNGSSGLTCKIFQVRSVPVELHFSS